MAALVNVVFVAAEALKRGLPWLYRATRATAEGVARAVDGIARGVTAVTRVVPPALGAVEARAVPALVWLGWALGATSAWALDRVARSCPPVGRAMARPVGAAVDALARASTAGARFVAPRLPRSGTVARVAFAFVVVVGAAAVVAQPALELAARMVDLDDAAPGGASFPPLDERSTVLAADGSVLAILHGEIDRRVVPLGQIPEHMRHAVITAEDRRFTEHEGYDPVGIARALTANLQAGEVVQGGSTITQQLAKQNYVGDERVLTRKASELVHAVALEQALSKDELLERYLNQVYFGRGAYGIAAAAEQFFALPPEELTIDQAALLAGMIRSPNALDPLDHPAAARQRRDQVLAAMAEEGYLDADTAAAAATQPAEVLEPRARVVAEPHVVEAVKREFLADEQFGETREERARLLFTGGLTIATTVDPRLQAAAAEAVTTHIRAGAGPTAAIAVVEPASGNVRALHSGADFAGEQFDYATQGRRQPGSALKPFVLAAAVERDGRLPTGLPGRSPATFTGPGLVEPWEVSNYRGADYGDLGGRDALVRSVNTAFADLIMDVGLDTVVDVAGRVGIDVDAAFGPADTRGPSIALGGLTHGVSPLELASAYGAFAHGGIHVRPHLIERVTERDSTAFMQHRPRAVRALDEDTNATMVEALQAVVRRGTGQRARLTGWEPIGKTGTTQDSADAWFVGAVPGLSAAVWVGHPDARTPIPGLTGGSLPAPIWRQLMTDALSDRDPVAFQDD